jgi:hypothetical protein
VQQCNGRLVAHLLVAAFKQLCCDGSGERNQKQDGHDRHQAAQGVFADHEAALPCEGERQAQYALFQEQFPDLGLLQRCGSDTNRLLA